jgi:hypothetical protein
MTTIQVTQPNQVVPAAKDIVARQDNWTEAQKVLFISLMNYLAGYGYQVGRVQDHFPLFRRLWDCFHAITPGSQSFNQAFLTITTSAEFISAGF